jgi:hypothetical protein
MLADLQSLNGGIKSKIDLNVAGFPITPMEYTLLLSMCGDTLAREGKTMLGQNREQGPLMKFAVEGITPYDYTPR